MCSLMCGPPEGPQANIFVTCELTLTHLLDTTALFPACLPVCVRVGHTLKIMSA